LKINPNWTERLPFLTVDLLQARIAWSIRLRWLAIVCFFLVILIIKYSFELPVPYNEVLYLLISLAVINLVYFLILKFFKEFAFPWEIAVLIIHVFLDLIFLTAIVHFTGGIENPIYLFYVFHVVLSSIIFPRKIPLVVATFVVVIFGILLYAEYSGLIQHYSIFNSQIHNNDLAVIITFLVFTVTVYVSTYICTTFMILYKNIKSKVDQQNFQLIESDKQKTKFYQFTSHELKSPIIAIKSTIDGIVKLYRIRLDNKVLNLLGRASNRCTQMLDIIKELLIISQNRSIAGIAEDIDINVNDIIEDIVNSERNTADAGNVSVEIKLASGKPVIKAKKSDIINIINNLISNAIRYNKENGKVYISTMMNKNDLNIIIQDTGIGIPENDLTKIYSEFYRSENARKKINYGTGLGLSLIKQLVEKYNGSIDVQSKINVGTTFSICFPNSVRVIG
jgi:signal transduction histidine kinase